MLLFSDVTTIFPQIDVSVSIYLDVFLVVCQQQVQYMVAVELCHPTPVVAANGTALHLLIIVGVNPINERPHSYLVGHNDKWFDSIVSFCLSLFEVQHLGTFYLYLYLHLLPGQGFLRFPSYNQILLHF